MLCLSGFELSSRWVPLKDVLLCKKMAPFAMNASNIERFAALTTQRQKDLFEVNKNSLQLHADLSVYPKFWGY